MRIFALSGEAFHTHQKKLSRTLRFRLCTRFLHPAAQYGRGLSALCAEAMRGGMDIGKKKLWRVRKWISHNHKREEISPMLGPAGKYM